MGGVVQPRVASVPGHVDNGTKAAVLVVPMPGRGQRPGGRAEGDIERVRKGRSTPDPGLRICTVRVSKNARKQDVDLKSLRRHPRTDPHRAVVRVRQGVPRA